MKLTEKSLAQIESTWTEKDILESLEKTEKKAKLYKKLAFLSFLWLPFGILAIQYRKGYNFLAGQDRDLSGGFVALNCFLSLVPTLFIFAVSFLKGQMMSWIGKDAKKEDLATVAKFAGPKIVKPSGVR